MGGKPEPHQFRQLSKQEIIDVQQLMINQLRQLLQQWSIMMHPQNIKSLL